MTHRTTSDAAIWISTLISQFPELTEELAPSAGARGTAASSASSGYAGSGAADPFDRLTDEHRARMAKRREEERGEALLLQQRHGLAVPGYTAAPIRLHISDTIRDVTDGVLELDEAVHAKLDLGRPRRADVPQRLRRIAELLDLVAADPVLARHVRDETRRMARRVARALGDTEALVRLPGRCPWCDSVSLRSAPAHGTVLCVNPACRCDDPGCGCHDDPAYRHLWAQDAWDVLTESEGGAAEAPAGAPAAGAPATSGLTASAQVTGAEQAGPEVPDVPDVADVADVSVAPAAARQGGGDR